MAKGAGSNLHQISLAIIQQQQSFKDLMISHGETIKQNGACVLSGNYIFVRLPTGCGKNASVCLKDVVIITLFPLN